MMRSVGSCSPVESSTTPSTAPLTCVSRCTNAPFLARSASTHSLVFCDTSGMMRPIASMRWKCVSSKVSVGYCFSSEDAYARSSAKTSMPAKPPPTTTTVSRRSRSGPAGRTDALSKFDVRRSRIATASSIVFRPMAFSAMPGIGNVRETAPAVTTIWSYSCVHVSSPAIGVIVAVLVACSMPVTFPAMTVVRLR